MINLINKTNDTIAVKSLVICGSMWTTYLFLIWGILPLIWPSSQNVVFYISSAIIQLVFLPLLLAGQNLTNNESEKRNDNMHILIKQSHQNLIDEIGILKDMIAKITEIREEENKIEFKLQKIDDELMILNHEL